MVLRTMNRIFLLCVLSLDPISLFTQETGKDIFWIGGALHWNMQQDQYGLAANFNCIRHSDEKKTWANAFSADMNYGRKFFETKLILGNLPEYRAEAGYAFSILFGKALMKDNSRTIFRIGPSINFVHWRGEIIGDRSTSFLGHNYIYRYSEKAAGGLTAAIGEHWLISDHFGMGIELYGTAHTDYCFIASRFNNRFFEGGIQFFLFQAGRLDR